MEQIYTIPVNEAFDGSRSDPALGCPFCALFRKLEEDELDIILGASMMEPDIRIKTNEMGFCLTHYRKMLGRKRRLGMGLMLESHLDAVKKKLSPTAKDLVLGVGQSEIDALSALEKSCYVCSRIDKNLAAMIATAVYLFETDLDFREKFKAQPFFCLPHYRAMADYGKRKMNKKIFREFYAVASGIENEYLKTLSGDVSWFCKKFDYQFEAEPWYNSKDSVERAIRFLSGDTGEIN
ncbi:MAG: DUF6062 family protein [Clostridia bacterium]|nr:DUF6062 family protein [Clostridia bacterium]